MSDPVTDVEIEDVLSSIRRLVGDEPRVKPRMAPESDPDDSPVKPARLVLTPSLLVPVPENDSSNDSEPALASDTQEKISKAPIVLDSGFDAEPAVEEIEAKVDPENDPTPEAETDFVFQSSQESGGTSAENGPEQAAWSNPETTLFNAAEIDDGTEKVFVAQDKRPIWEASVPQQATSPFEVKPQAEPNQDALEQADRENPFAADLDDAESAESDSVPEDDTPYSTATLGAKIAALEAKIGQTQDQWEPDGELGDDYAGTKVETIEWQDHEAEGRVETHSYNGPPTQSEPDVLDEVADQTDRATEASGAADFTKATTKVTAQAPQAPVTAGPQLSDEPIDLMADDDAILDEESLRELVADIVRQELQGALGERITRNVRKLVRREIHRALTAQELD